MKQKKLIIAVLTAVLLAVPSMVQAKSVQAKAKMLEVSFDYQRQPGPGSNQYAVWIENEKGEVVRTLFVTSYTTKGRARGGQQPQRGYIVRPACVPTWVKTVIADELTDQQLDAVTGATPQASGTQTFTWDFKDQQGKTVPKGNYKVVVEATLFNDSDIIYSGTFSTKDKTGDITITSELTKHDERHKDMVTNVKAMLK
ncbi:MAG: DUF2271 domain-containing protein [Prevotella sp.]|nr:DUF2271 domain-containing protein [Prevotella sp.]